MCVVGSGTFPVLPVSNTSLSEFVIDVALREMAKSGLVPSVWQFSRKDVPSRRNAIMPLQLRYRGRDSGI